VAISGYGPSERNRAESLRCSLLALASADDQGGRSANADLVIWLIRPMHSFRQSSARPVRRQDPHRRHELLGRVSNGVDAELETHRRGDQQARQEWFFVRASGQGPDITSATSSSRKSRLPSWHPMGRIAMARRAMIADALAKVLQIDRYPRIRSSYAGLLDAGLCPTSRRPCVRMPDHTAKELSNTSWSARRQRPEPDGRLGAARHGSSGA